MGRRRILIADDEALFRTCAADSLRAHFQGAEVLEAEDGAAALAILERTSVDVLITDLEMPKLGGFELVARISSHRMPIQIIVVSAHINDVIRGALDDLGALARVDKPIDLDALHRAVERMLALPRAHVSGVTLAGFVQLLEIEQQTCALRVVSPDGVGTLVFEGGRLLDAWTGELRGDAAAMAIFGFKDCTLDMVGALRTDHARVTLPLSFLLLESARRKDERTEPPEPVAGQWEIVSVPVPAPDSKAPDSLGGPTSAGPPSSLAPPVSSVARPLVSDEMDARVRRTLNTAMGVDGALGAAVVDVDLEATLGSRGNAGLDVETAAAGAVAALHAKRELLGRLHIAGAVDEILVTLTERYWVLRPLGAQAPSIHVFLIIDRAAGNLALARHALGKIEASWQGDAPSETKP